MHMYVSKCDMVVQDMFSLVLCVQLGEFPDLGDIQGSVHDQFNHVWSP